MRREGGEGGRGRRGGRGGGGKEGGGGGGEETPYFMTSHTQTIKLSAVEKLTRHVDSSQLTNDVGGFLPYRHDQWLSLRQVSRQALVGEWRGTC